MTDAQSQPDRGGQPQRTVSPVLLVAVFIAVLAAIFIVQNSEGTRVTWLFVETREAPLWTVIFVSGLAGYVLGRLIEYGVRRSRRNGYARRGG